jgi:hypothetical protein
MHKNPRLKQKPEDMYCIKIQINGAIKYTFRTSITPLKGTFRSGNTQQIWIIKARLKVCTHNNSG